MIQAEIRCNTCGRRQATRDYSDDTAAEMLTKSLCYDCLYWQNRIDSIQAGNKVFVIADRTCFQLDEENIPDKWKGHDAERFTIKFHDGSELATTNLWKNGVVPARFLERLPDNAIITKEIQ